MTKNNISVLLVDDHSLVRRGFRRMLEDETDIQVVGEASSGTEAVELARKLRPQVILMDCALQGESGITATRKIIEALPDTAVLMLSMHSEETLVRQSLEAGARGYILKNASDLDLAAAIRRVLDGNVVLDPQVKRVETLRGERTAGLTARELEILQLIAIGKSNMENFARSSLSATSSPRKANLKLGTQHGDSDDILKVMAAFGVNHICALPPELDKGGDWSLEALTRKREHIESYGLKPVALRLIHPSYVSKSEIRHVMTGESPDRDREIDAIC